MSAFTTLELEAAAMEPGTRKKMVCPSCNGGGSGEISLSLFKDHEGRMAWKCFRASCGYKGNPRGVSGEPTKKKPTPKYYTKPYTSVSEPVLLHGSYKGISSRGEWLWDRFDFVPPCYWSDDDKRYVLPIYGPQGQLRGHQAYSFEPVKLKCVTYRERIDEEFLHWSRNERKRPSIIVEDWFSAEKVSRAGATGIALLGTTLNPERIAEIRANSMGNQVILALDADAYGKSIKYCIEYGGMFTPPLRVWRLVRDLKYESVERIKEALTNDGNFDTRRDANQ